MRAAGRSFLRSKEVFMFFPLPLVVDYVVVTLFDCYDYIGDLLVACKGGAKLPIKGIFIELFRPALIIKFCF